MSDYEVYVRNSQEKKIQEEIVRFKSEWKDYKEQEIRDWVTTNRPKTETFTEEGTRYFDFNPSDLPR